MLKKTISLFTVICLITGIIATGAFASGFAEGGSETLPASADTGGTTGDTGTIQQGLRTFDGTNADGTLNPDTNINTNPVSYTHLDVYKRQP